MKVYLIGALSNRTGIFPVAEKLRHAGHDVFDDWISPGPEADEQWQRYERQRGRNYRDALNGTHAKHIFEYDFKHLADSDAVVLVLPAGKSGHLEMGWAIGQGKKAFVYLPKEPERYDLMYLLADDVITSMDELLDELKEEHDTDADTRSAWGVGSGQELAGRYSAGAPTGH